MTDLYINICLMRETVRAEKCGKLIHLECTELSLIGDHLREEHGFDIDHARTVFYGTCNECRKEGKL